MREASFLSPCDVSTVELKERESVSSKNHQSIVGVTAQEADPSLFAAADNSSVDDLNVRSSEESRKERRPHSLHPGDYDREEGALVQNVGLQMRWQSSSECFGWESEVDQEALSEHGSHRNRVHWEETSTSHGINWQASSLRRDSQWNVRSLPCVFISVAGFT